MMNRVAAGSTYGCVYFQQFIYHINQSRVLLMTVLVDRVAAGSTYDCVYIGKGMLM